MNPTCVWCDQAAVDDHHLTAHGPDGSYTDPDLTAPMCHDCHEFAGEELRDAGLETHDGTWSPPEAIARALDMVGLHLWRWSEHHHTELIARIAAKLRQWAADLRDFCSLLDEHLPHWRSLLPTRAAA